MLSGIIDTFSTYLIYSSLKQKWVISRGEGEGLDDALPHVKTALVPSPTPLHFESHGKKQRMSTMNTAMKRITPLLVLLVLGLATLMMLPGCGGGRKAQDPATLLPGDANVALTVPNINTALTDLKGMYARLVEKFPDLSRLPEDIKRSIGFNFLLPESLKELGIDPAGAGGMAIRGQDTYVVLPITRAARFNEALSNRLKAALGPEVRIQDYQTTGSKLRGKALFIGERTDPDVVWVTDDKLAHICYVHRPMGENPGARLQSILDMTPQSRLAANAPYDSLKKLFAQKATRNPSVYLLPNKEAQSILSKMVNRRLGNSPSTRQILKGINSTISASEGMGLNFQTDETGLTIGFQVLLNGEGSQSMAWLKNVDSIHAVDWAEVIDGDALMATRLTIPPENAAHLLSQLLTPDALTNLATAGVTGSTATKGRGGKKGGSRGGAGQNKGKDATSVIFDDLKLGQMAQHMTGRLGLAIYQINLVSGVSDLFSQKAGSGRKMAPTDDMFNSTAYIQIKDANALRSFLNGLVEPDDEEGDLTAIGTNGAGTDAGSSAGAGAAGAAGADNTANNDTAQAVANTAPVKIRQWTVKMREGGDNREGETGTWSIIWNGKAMATMTLKDQILIIGSNPQRVEAALRKGAKGVPTNSASNLSSRLVTDAAKTLFSQTPTGYNGLYMNIQSILTELPIFYMILPTLGQSLSMIQEAVIYGALADDARSLGGQAVISLTPSTKNTSPAIKN